MNHPISRQSPLGWRRPVNREPLWRGVLLTCAAAAALAAGSQVPFLAAATASGRTQTVQAVQEPPGGRIPQSSPGFLSLLPAGPTAGGVVLPSGRVVRPVGDAIPVGLLPLGLALSPDGRWLAVLNDGERNESISVINTATNAVASTLPVRMAFTGIVFSPDGARVWVAGGGSSSVTPYAFDGQTGTLHPEEAVAVPGYPSGLAFSMDGRALYCTENYGNHLVVIDPATRSVTSSVPTDHMPYGVTAAADGAWVTSWVDGTLQELSNQGKVECSLKIGRFASPIAASPDRRYLYAGAVNDDRLVVVDTGASGGPRVIRQISLEPYGGAKLGAVPGAIAVSPTSGEVFVALSGLNAVAVIDPVRMSVRGLIPTGWYPAALSVTPDGSRLFIAAAKGVGSGPNTESKKSVAVLDFGIVYSVPLTGPGSAQSELASWTATAFESNGLQPDGKPRPEPKVSLPPIRHVVFIVKENRTYDQVFGDLGRGNGDPDVAFYGKGITPNAHTLADRFALADNYYSDGEVSVQGHEWTLGANSPDYTERTWAQIYAGHDRANDITTAPISYPPAGYLMEECARRGVSCRMYGDELMRDSKGKLLASVRDDKCPNYKGWDLKYPDTQREAAWEAEFRNGIFPRYSYLWLPDDHTAGTSADHRTPQAMVATNDLAVARVVSTISHSPEWRDTLIFVTEDDSQDGLDHVDAHRNLLLIIGPWVQPGQITHRHYSQVSVLRTIELLLGIPPLSQYDALAEPIGDVFGSQPDVRPYDVVPETVDINAMNTPRSAMHKASERLDLSAPDTSTDGLLERILLADAQAYAQQHAGNRQPGKL